MTSEKFRRFVTVGQYAVLFDGEIVKIHDNSTDNFSIKWFQKAHWKEVLSQLDSVITNHIKDVSSKEDTKINFSPNEITGNLVKISYYFKPNSLSLEFCLMPSYLTYNVVNTESYQSLENLKTLKALKYTSVKMWNYILVISISLPSEIRSFKSEITNQKFVGFRNDEPCDIAFASEVRMQSLKRNSTCKGGNVKKRSRKSEEDESPIESHYWTRSELKRKCSPESVESVSDNSVVCGIVSAETCSDQNPAKLKKSKIEELFSDLIATAKDSNSMDFEKHMLRQRTKPKGYYWEGEYTKGRTKSFVEKVKNKDSGKEKILKTKRKLKYISSPSLNNSSEMLENCRVPFKNDSIVSKNGTPQKSVSDRNLNKTKIKTEVSNIKSEAPVVKDKFIPTPKRKMKDNSSPSSSDRSQIQENCRIPSQSDCVVSKTENQQAQTPKTLNKKKVSENISQEKKVKTEVLKVTSETPLVNGEIVPKPKPSCVFDIARLFANAGFKNVVPKTEPEEKPKMKKFGLKKNIKSRTRKQKGAQSRKKDEKVEEIIESEEQKPNLEERMNGSLVSDGVKKEEVVKISLKDFDQCNPSKISKEIKKIKEVKLLTPIHLLYLVKENEEFLKKILKGVVPSDRHQQYCEGGFKRGDLKYRVNVVPFTDAQLDVINSLLLELFQECKDKLQSKFIDYMLTVLLPEMLKKIFIDVLGMTTDAAEEVMSGNSLSDAIQDDI